MFLIIVSVKPFQHYPTNRRPPLTIDKRPWWALALQLPSLKTTLSEAEQDQQTLFEITGEPVLRGLAWITYGPLMAVVGVFVVGSLAWSLEISEQSGTNRALFACFMFVLPIIFWGIGGAAANKLMAKSLARQAAANTERVRIAVDSTAQTIQINQDTPIPFAAVRSFKLITDSGVEYAPNAETNPPAHLILDSKRGQITLLKKSMGTAQQKQQLVSKIEALIMPE